jgi:hypothetical protein
MSCYMQFVFFARLPPSLMYCSSSSYFFLVSLSPVERNHETQTTKRLTNVWGQGIIAHLADYINGPL